MKLIFFILKKFTSLCEQAVVSSCNLNFNYLVYKIYEFFAVSEISTINFASEFKIQLPNRDQGQVAEHKREIYLSELSSLRG